MACQKKDFRSDTIYLFWQPSCSHCHHAIEFFNTELKNIRVEMIDISKEEGHKKLVLAINKFNLGNTVYTPLFIVNGKHFSGWNENLAKDFKEIAPMFEK